MMNHETKKHQTYRERIQSAVLPPEQIFKDNLTLIIVDECHHIPAETFFDVITKFRSKCILGLSATLQRKDKKECKQRQERMLTTPRGHLKV